ncbi:TIM barrel protein [Rhizobium leguminosarum]|uniref:TIM barrel protein n=1 Tax=Rhizobium leguminosarum TaxID=384 RepID=UPI001C95525A|nr:TIM barrel protein [Rhizobium leguminosarum]MBY5412099.1 TIM barrel protein [Rhizobium leguminosarum]
MIKFGVAGFPIAFNNSKRGRDRSRIFEWVREQGLDALELQMTYGPRTSVETCLRYRELAANFGIKISVHAAYYIVLTSAERDKVERSIDTLKRTFDLADHLGAQEVILHPGPLYSRPESEAVARFEDNANEFTNGLGATEVGLFIETAGKVGQLGSVEQILSLSSRLPGVHPCIDFGHVHARTLGTLDTPQAISQVGKVISTFLRSHPEKCVHFHFTPIHYGPRGEIQHRAIDDQYEQEADLLTGPSHTRFYHPRPEPVARTLSEIDAKFTVISETYNSQEIGAKALKSWFEQQMEAVPDATAVV